MGQKGSRLGGLFEAEGNRDLVGKTFTSLIAYKNLGRGPGPEKELLPERTFLPERLTAWQVKHLIIKQLLFLTSPKTALLPFEALGPYPSAEDVIETSTA